MREFILRGKLDWFLFHGREECDAPLGPPHLPESPRQVKAPKDWLVVGERNNIIRG